MIRFKGILNSNVNTSQLKRFSSFWVYCFHANISKLISNDIVCVSNRNTVFNTHNFGVGTRQVILFMYYSFISLNLNSNLTKSNFTIATVESSHNTFCSFGISGRSEEHTSELQSRPHLVCRLLLDK